MNYYEGEFIIQAHIDKCYTGDDVTIKAQVYEYVNI